ncbi:MAG: ABC transporter permease, partial [Lachnospiraceae bacterium]
MKISDLLRMSLESLFKRKVRTILTVLGVLVGTTSIVVMVSLGFGLKTSMMEEMESYGSMTLIEVTDPNLYYSDSSNQDVKHLDDELVENFAAMEHVDLVCPRITTSAIFKSGIYEANEQITGVRLEELEKLNIELEEGTLPQKGEGLKLVFGNMILSYFYNSKTYVYDYWDNGTLPNIDLMNDTIFMILDSDRYYMAGQPDENGTPIPN